MLVLIVSIFDSSLVTSSLVAIVIFTAEFNLSAENKNYYNNKEYFSDVKIIDCGY